MKPIVAGIFGCCLVACASESAGTMAQSEDGWIALDNQAGSARRRTADSAPTGLDAGKAQDQEVGIGGTTGTQGPGLGLVLPGALNAAKFKALVQAGQVPSSDDLPMEGWFNEHDSPLPLASPERPVDLHALAAVVAEPNQEPEILLQIGFNTAAALAALQPNVDLVVAVDRSASLGPEALATVKAGIADVADSLPAQSSIAVVFFDSGAEEVFAASPYTANLKGQLLASLSDVKSQGGTDLYGGLQFAIERLGNFKTAAKQRRILLATDGAGTLGEHGPADFVDLGKKSGISISAIGAGVQANGALLTNLAKVTGGTYYEAPTLGSLQAAFSQDLMSLLVPVASNLSVSIQLGNGWSVRDAFGLPFATVGGTLYLGKANKPAVGDASSSDVSGAQDALGSDAVVPDAGAPPADPVLGQLFPSQRNGLVAVRLQPPSGTVLDQAFALLLAKTNWSYTLTASDTSKSHEKLVEINGLVAIPDGGYEFYTHPIARRTAAIVRAGEAMKAACAQAGNGKKGDAVATVQAAMAFMGRMDGEVQKSGLDPAGAMNAAHGLMQKLVDNLKASK